MPATHVLLAAFGVAGVIVAWVAFRLGGRRARRAAAELTSLNEIARQLLRARLDVDELCELVYWQAGQIIPTALFQLGLFEGDAYHVKIWVRDDERLPETVFPEGGLKGIVGWVRRTGQPLLVEDFEAQRDELPAFPEFRLESPPRSGLFVPLIAGTSTIGVLAVQSRQPRRFTDQHQRLLTALANQAAWAIRNAQLYERAQERAEHLNLIGQVVAQVSAVQPLPGLFHQIVTLIQETFGYYCVSIFVYEDGCLRIGASTSQSFAGQVPEIEPGDGMIGWVAQEGKTALASDVADDPRYQALGLLAETRSEIALPLRVEERVLGVLDVQSDRLNAFDDEDVFLLETLAAQLALAVEQAQTYDAERRLRQRLEALIEVSQALVSLLDLDDLLDRVVEAISDTFGFERVHIFVIVEDRLVFRAGSGTHSVRWLIDELSYALDAPGLIPEVARTGRAVRIGDVTETRIYRPGPGLEDTRSEMVIPIRMAGRVLGVIDLQSELSDAFSEEDLILMQALADSVAVAIRNAALYTAERRRRSLADSLRDIGAALVSDLDLDRVLSRILSGLGRVVTLDTAAILLFEPETASLVVAAATGQSGSEGIVGKQLSLGGLDRLDEEELEALVREAYHELLDVADVHSCIAAPLVVGGSRIGYLIADYYQPGHYGQFDREIVRAFANQAAVAINNARLYAAQQEEAWVTTALLQVAETVNAQVEVGETLETIARLTALLAGVTRCLILRWDASSGLCYPGAQFGIAAERYNELAASPLPAREHPFLELLTLVDEPLGAGEGYQLHLPEPVARLMMASSVLGFPLRAKGETVGLLLVDDPRRGQAADPRLLNILTGIAHQTATALEAAMLQARLVERDRLEQELRVAHDIQASFIPEVPPQEPGWQIAATWRAAHQVSGDFYDFIPLRDGLWGLVIADVADKGIPAALFMAVCRTLLRAAAISRTSPAETLIRMNQLLFNDSRGDLFVTVFYAVWNPLTGRVTYASGGHNPALLVRGGERPRVTALRCRGIALGVLPEIELEEHGVTLHAGDMLVAYTDGVTEAMRADYTEWGLERFRATLRRFHALPVEQIMGRVLGAIDEFIGGAPQSDDLTFWILKREEPQTGAG